MNIIKNTYNYKIIKKKISILLVEGDFSGKFIEIPDKFSFSPKNYRFLFIPIIFSERLGNIGPRTEKIYDSEFFLLIFILFLINNYIIIFKIRSVAKTYIYFNHILYIHLYANSGINHKTQVRNFFIIT